VMHDELAQLPSAPNDVDGRCRLCDHCTDITATVSCVAVRAADHRGFVASGR
jgi:hypothetical protein